MKRYQVLGLMMTFAIAVVILVLTLMPPGAMQQAGVGDKVAHIAAFAVLVLPVAFFYRQLLARAIPLAFAFGLTIEIVQPSFGRSFELGDLAADAVGIAIGAILGAGMRRLVLAYLPARYWFWATK